MKKFSIIIPCLNCQDTIRESLDSLSSQSFKNYELIIIDSLSKDSEQFGSLCPFFTEGRMPGSMWIQKR